MKPKEKADKLVNEFYIEIMDYDTDLSEEIVISLLSIKHAKICVKEIINVLQEIPDLKVEGNILLDKIEYNRNVLKELNLL